MRIDEFNKYKRIVESVSDPEMVSNNPEMLKVYKWMDTTGRIDEGFFGAIWTWLKRNFSPTARRIYKLADEYGRELKKEMEAEFGRKADSKDLAAQMRSSWAGRISGDIKEKMEIEAGDDDDYIELVRLLVNKETLEGKKAMLKYLDKADAKYFGKKIQEEQKSTEEQINSKTASLNADERTKVEAIRKHLEEQIERSDYKNVLKIAFPDNAARKVFIDALSNNILMATTQKVPGVKIDNKTADSYLRKIVDDAKNSAASVGGKTEDAIRSILKNVLKILADTNRITEISKMTRKAIEDAKESAKNKGASNANSDDDNDDVKDELTTAHTDDIIQDDDVDTGIDIAKTATGKKSPTSDDIVGQVNKYINDQFLDDDNVSYFVTKLNTEVKRFNNQPDDKRSSIADENNYNLDKENKLSPATSVDVKKLLENFIQIAGEIAPYFLRKGTSDDHIRYYKTIIAVIFEIYAVKKDVSNSISSSDITKIVNNIREQNKEEYK
jgi:hypothetical protein